MTVCERVLRGFKFELPSTSIRRLVITAELVGQPAEVLEDLLKTHRGEQSAEARSQTLAFAQDFFTQHGLELRFSDEAVELLVERSKAQGVDAREYCERLFKDYQFGLKLASQNTGQTRFELDSEAVRDPENFLSRIIVESYRPEE